MAKHRTGGVVLRARVAPAGFTLIELVMVISIAAILAAVAFSRIDVGSFDTEGSANRVAAMVRYAQKTAISQHRTVAVVVTTNNIKLCYDDDTCGAGMVPDPSGGGGFSFTSSNVNFGGTGNFTFSALGKPTPGPSSVTVTGTGTKTITVAAETGYVQYVP